MYMVVQTSCACIPLSSQTIPVHVLIQTPDIVLKFFFPPRQILELPSKLFYKDKLTCKAVFPMTGPKDIPAIKFIGVDGHEMQEEDSPSYFNLQECSKIAEQVYTCVVNLISRPHGNF